jgi:hypothetical protein
LSQCLENTASFSIEDENITEKSAGRGDFFPLLCLCVFSIVAANRRVMRRDLKNLRMTVIPAHPGIQNILKSLDPGFANMKLRFVNMKLRFRRYDDLPNFRRNSKLSRKKCKRSVRRRATRRGFSFDAAGDVSGMEKNGKQ